MKKKLLLSLCLMVCCVTALGAHSQAAAQTPKLASQAACVIDADNGEILYQKHANQQLRPASITKQMTALLVLENGNLDDKVKVTEEALCTVDADSTRIGFEAGEKRTVRDLMYCMLVDSANDAANILAEYVGGDVETFVGMMNQRAQELGCTNTHFVNPNGLDDDGHLSTAHDMALISYALMDHPDYFTFAGTTEYDLDTDKVIQDAWQIWTKVDMLNPSSEYYDKEVLAGKTGWTTLANHTFVVYMQRGDRTLIIVTMYSLEWTEKYKDSVKLMDYCCDNYAELSLSAADYGSSAVTAAESSGLDVTVDTDSLEDLSVYLPSSLDASALRYSVTLDEDGTTPLLSIGIAEDSQTAYREATHINGATACLLTVALPVKQALWSKTAAQSSGSAAELIVQSTDMTRLVITLAAALLVVLSVLFIIVRSVKRRKAKKQAAEHKPLEIVIPTPEQYQQTESADQTDANSDSDTK